MKLCGNQRLVEKIMEAERDYTDTVKFKEKYEQLQTAGILEKDLLRYKELHRQFDVWGNEKGTDYSRVVIAYDISKLG